MRKRKEPGKPEIGTYIDPLTDFGFKYLFGREANKELLIAFLNAMLGGKKIITDLVYSKNEFFGPLAESRTMVFDLFCTGSDGDRFLIEVQRIRQRFFKDRAVYYLSRLIHDQAPKGRSWDYALKEVYFIGIMDFAFEDSNIADYIQYVHMAYEKTNKPFFKKLGLVFVELPKFTKQENELETGVDEWMYILRNLSRLEKIPVNLNKPVFYHLFDTAAVSKLKKEEFMNYERDLMAAWDEYAIKKTIEYDLEVARMEGLEKGKAEGKAEIIKKLLRSGSFSIAQIAEIADVSTRFVENLRDK